MHFSAANVCGSSPLTREKLIDALVTHAVGGTSPLTQGKPQVKPQRKSSSPLTRGKRNDLASNRPHGRLIPAHAGKTRARGRASGSRWADPRSRGENQSRVRRHTPPPGSSPLTQGKLMAFHPRTLVAGLIPAHAGKTCLQRCGCGRRRAHPCSRGENRAEKAHPAFQKGSSLLTQGKLDV